MGIIDGHILDAFPFVILVLGALVTRRCIRLGPWDFIKYELFVLQDFGITILRKNTIPHFFQGRKQ